jgi:hypothetical protein
MNQNWTRIALFMLLLTFPICLLSQTFTTVESGRYYTAMAKDAANNIYVTRYDAGTDRYQVVKYINGAGSPQVIYNGLQYGDPDYAWGLAVTSNGDVYIAASNVENRVIRLPYNSSSGTYGTATTFLSGKYYSQIATDASNNIYTLEHASATSDYAIVRYPAGSTTGTQLYHGLAIGGGYQYPTGLAIAPNGDIYTTDGFDDGTNAPGAVYRFTAVSGYSNRTTLSSGKFSTSLALDPQGNLYVSEYDGVRFVLNRYNGATGTPVKVRDLLIGDFYPWGIVALNSQNIYFATGSASNGGSVQHLLNTPEVQARNVVSTGVTDKQVTLNWTNGSGVSRMVFIAAASTGTPAPVNGTNYAASATFGSGSQIASSGWYCVYNGSGTTVTVSGLAAETTYRAMVVENNGSNFYQTATATNNPFNITTTAVLPVTFGPLTAVLNNGRLKVSWSTLSETGNDHLDIQGSVDGDDFRSIGILASQAANGNSDIALNYTFVQSHAEMLYSWPLAIIAISLMAFAVFYKGKNKWLTMLLLVGAVTIGSCSKKEALDDTGAGNLYIRIAQVDKDGTTSYSKVVRVQKD